MAFCGKCGSELDNNIKFCPGCGAPAEEVPTAEEGFAAEDIANNKTMAVLAYIIFLIPLFAAKDSKFARYHTNQGIILAIAAAAYAIIYGILSAVILAISWRLYFVITIIGLVGAVFAVLAVIGIINAAGGKAKPLPVIGKFRILK